MAANSVELRCPVLTDAEGQYRTKQATHRLPGVRNEQVLPPEGKVCSGLRGNVQKAAETTASLAKAGSNKNDDPVDWLGREHDTEQRLPPGSSHRVIGESKRKEKSNASSIRSYGP